jgi:hypothetical protein
MARHLRQAGDEALAAQRWQAQQASREQRALNGELGPEAQILALSARYMALRASGQHEAAAELKRQAYAIREAQVTA